MNFALSDEQRLIQENAAAALAEAAGLERLRAVIASPEGWDEKLWALFARELGFVGLMAPAAFGGSGLGAVEMALVLEETGRRLAVTPFFETAVLAMQAILIAGDAPQQQALAPALASGEQKAAFAFAATAEGVRPVLTRSASGWVLDGAAGFVTFAHVADLLIVAARTGDGCSLIALPASTHGVHIERQSAMDLTRPFGQVTFRRVVVPDDAILGEPGNARDALERTLAVGAGLLAAEQTGGSAFCLSSTVDYAKQRVQFGRLIASFQAVKHVLADMMLQVEAARSAMLYAAAAIDSGGDELFEATSVARAWCSEAFKFCAGEAIQLHGGIGFTWEHHAHLYFKRARSSSSWLGSPDEHRERIARLIGLDTAESA